PALIVLLLGIVQTIRGTRNRWNEVVFVTATVLYFAVISARADNLGVRYLLPIFPLIYIWGSKIVPVYREHQVGRAVLLILLAWHVFAAASSFPNYIPYFN